MYDQPTADDLLDAASTHLEQNVIPVLRAGDDRKLYFQTLVAAHVLRLVGRELDMRPRHLADEWARLNKLTKDEQSLPDTADLTAAIDERNHALCNAIRAGVYDTPDEQTRLINHLFDRTVAQLEVNNPRFMLMLMQELGAG